MMPHFFRPKQKQFSLTGEKRLAFDAPDFNKDAEDIGNALKAKEAQNDKVDKINQLKTLAADAMKDGEKKVSSMTQFALRTNLFLRRENVMIGNKPAQIPEEMIQADYVKTLIQKAGWDKTSPGSREVQKTTPELQTYLRDNRDKMMQDIKKDFDDFMENPKANFQDFLEVLNARLGMLNDKVQVNVPGAEALLQLLYKSNWINSRKELEDLKDRMNPPVARKPEVAPPIVEKRQAPVRMQKTPFTSMTSAQELEADSESQARMAKTNVSHMNAMDRKERLENLARAAKAEQNGGPVRKGPSAQTEYDVERGHATPLDAERTLLKEYVIKLAYAPKRPAGLDNARNLLNKDVQWKQMTEDGQRDLLNSVRKILGMTSKYIENLPPMPESFDKQGEKLTAQYRLLAQSQSREYFDVLLMGRAYPHATLDERSALSKQRVTILSQWDQWEKNPITRATEMKKFIDAFKKMEDKEGMDRHSDMFLAVLNGSAVMKPVQEVPQYQNYTPPAPQRTESAPQAPVNNFAPDVAPTPPPSAPMNSTDRLVAQGRLNPEAGRKINERMETSQRMEARKDVYTLTVPLDAEDAIVIYPKGEDSHSRNAVVYYPDKREWVGMSETDVARNHGIWVSLDDVTHSDDRKTSQGITIHFTHEAQYMVQKNDWKQVNRKTYDPAAELEKKRDIERAKVTEAKTSAVNKWNFDMTSAAKTFDGKKLGYYYEHDADSDVVYATDPDMKKFWFWNPKSASWDTMARGDLSKDVLDGLDEKQYTEEKSLPKHLRTKKAPEKVNTNTEKAPVKEKEVAPPTTREKTEKLVGEPVSRLNAELSKFAIQKQKLEKLQVGSEERKAEIEKTKTLLKEMFLGEFGEVYRALDERKDDALIKALDKAHLPQDEWNISNLKLAFPKGFADSLL